MIFSLYKFNLKITSFNCVGRFISLNKVNASLYVLSPINSKKLNISFNFLFLETLFTYLDKIKLLYERKSTSLLPFLLYITRISIISSEVQNISTHGR